MIRILFQKNKWRGNLKQVWLQRKPEFVWLALVQVDYLFFITSINSKHAAPRKAQMLMILMLYVMKSILHLVDYGICHGEQVRSYNIEQTSIQFYYHLYKYLVIIHTQMFDFLSQERSLVERQCIVVCTTICGQMHQRYDVFVIIE